MHHLDQCPVCGHDQFAYFITCKDHTVSHEHFNVVRCEKCSFHFTNPRPEDHKLSSYYDSPDYISHTDRPNTLTNRLYKIARHFTLKHKVNLITKISNGSLLDYGCGTGDFLTVAQSKGWAVQGVEPDSKARNIANQKLSAKIYQTLPSSTPQPFNVITLWHVLEHIPALNQTLETLRSQLSPQGYLILALPNLESFDASHYRTHWAAYDVPRHLYHFSKSTLAQLLQQHKLSIRRIIPMKLDAFYVSILSEKYIAQENNRSKHSVYPKALLVGLKSNYYAKKEQNQYSSLIYVIQQV